MPDGGGTIRGSIFVRETAGGRRLFKAERLRSGNWLLVETSGASRRTVNHDDFCVAYEKVPDARTS